MIPNIKKGKSFVGAGRYYLHDKQAGVAEKSKVQLQTNDRVAWSETRNCANTDPELALVEMWKTADDQAYLKLASGQNTGGRKTTDPVKTISLSWHPTETPTREDMITAADGFLAKMGWAEHQAVYLAHNDTAHPHMHIILNRVHPETGLTLDDYKDKKRSQAWALDYEREQGRVWCEKRLETENGQHRAANTNLPHNVIEMTRAAERAYAVQEKSREDLDKLDRDLLKQNQRAEREAFFDDGKSLFKQTRLDVFNEVRAEFKETWRDYYRDKQDREAEAEASSQTAIGRALYFAKHGEFEQAWAAIGDKDSVRDAVRGEFAERRADIRQEQTATTRIRQELASDELRVRREDDYKALIERQAAERAEMRALHALGERADPAGDRAASLVAQTLDARSANQNIDPAAKAPVAANSNPAPAIERATGTGLSEGTGANTELIAPVVAEIAPPFDVGLPPVDRENAALGHQFDRAVTGAADAGAGAIGALANYLADEIGELVSPTPPEVREARAKAAAEVEAAKPVPENPYLKYATPAKEMSEAERDEAARDDYWDKERERRRDR
ncbi:MAG: relaxase/mobilization nuclease domain-containing protein [Hyphomicrobiaceae bacterium]